MSTTATVTTIPNCDLCGALAYADCRIPAYSTWGNVCKVCFDRFKCTLGTGKGQEFILAASADALDSLKPVLTAGDMVTDRWMRAVDQAMRLYVGCDRADLEDFGIEFDFDAEFKAGTTPGQCAAKAIAVANKAGF